MIIITVSRRRPISKAWEDGRLLISTPSLITVGNVVGKKQKHGYQARERASDRPTAPAARGAARQVASRSLARQRDPTRKGTTRTQCGNSKLAESTGSHLDGTSPNPCPVIYCRARARSNEVWTSLLNYTSCQPLTDQFLSRSSSSFLARARSLSLFLPLVLSASLYPAFSLWLHGARPATRCRATSTAAGMCLARLPHSYTSFIRSRRGSRKSYLSFVVNGCNECCWVTPREESSVICCPCKRGYLRGSTRAPYRNTRRRRAVCLGNFHNILHNFLKRVIKCSKIMKLLHRRAASVCILLPDANQAEI